MKSRERRLLDKDKEIRKLKGTAGHYFTCTISAAIENEKLKQELADTKKKLDICVKALNKIANTDIKVIEKESRYYARAMFSVTNNALGRIQDIEQIKDKEQQ